MLSIKEAKKTMERVIEPQIIDRDVEPIPLWNAGGRVLAQEVIAREHVPHFERSPVDGFALCANDTPQASAAEPVTLKVIGTVAAGSYTEKRITSGTAIKVFTGAPLPEGADCIIKIEEVDERTSQAGESLFVKIKRPVERGEAIVSRGEDITCGEHLFSKGTVLSSSHMGILSTLGIDPLFVYKKPVVGVFSTGNELVGLHSQLKYGQIRASNIYTLAEIIREAGGIPVNFGVVGDRSEDIAELYQRAQKLKIPLVISTGGTASGDYDVIKEAMDKASTNRLFDKVAIRPGAPVVASEKEGQLIVGLSGNPAGATVGMLILLLPIIARIGGSDNQLIRTRGRLRKSIVRKRGLKGYLWAQYCEEEGQLYASPLEEQYCGALKNHAESNCLIEVPSGRVNLSIGDAVNILRLS